MACFRARISSSAWRREAAVGTTPGEEGHSPGPPPPLPAAPPAAAAACTAESPVTSADALFSTALSSAPFTPKPPGRGALLVLGRTPGAMPLRGPGGPGVGGPKGAEKLDTMALDAGPGRWYALGEARERGDACALGEVYGEGEV